MSTLLEWLITDPNVAPEFRRQFADTPAAKQLLRDQEIRDKHHKDYLADLAEERRQREREVDL